MAEIKVFNRAHVPIHGALAWAGNQMQSFNDLGAGGDFKFDVGGGWTDIFIVVGSADNKFDGAINGKIDFGRLLLQGLALVQVVFVGPGALPGFTLIAHQIGVDLWKLDVSPVGAGEHGDIQVKAAPGLKIFPVGESGLYCPHGYDVTISGGEMTGKYDKVAKVFTVTEVKPLHLHWKNNTNGNTGDRVAAT